jgi:hypothetical protein
MREALARDNIKYHHQREIEREKKPTTIITETEQKLNSSF